MILLRVTLIALCSFKSSRLVLIFLSVFNLFVFFPDGPSEFSEAASNGNSIIKVYPISRNLMLIPRNLRCHSEISIGFYLSNTIEPTRSSQRDHWHVPLESRYSQERRHHKLFIRGWQKPNRWIPFFQFSKWSVYIKGPLFVRWIYNSG